MITTKRLYQINSSRILQHIRRNRGKSRISIAEDLELDRSTITKVVRDLMERGLVRTTGKYRGKPGVGRMATGLEINPDFSLVLGIEAQTEFFDAVLVNLDGVRIESRRYEYDKKAEGLASQLELIVKEAMGRATELKKDLAGVGIGLSGIVDPYRGIILHSNPLGVDEPYPLRELLESKLDLPIFVENDANCCCWGELAFRHGENVRNFMTILGEFRNVDVARNRVSGTAFGIGIVIRGSVFHGDTFTAGEFRSLRYDQKHPSHSQFAITDAEAARLPKDAAVLGRVFDEVAYNMSLLVNCLDMTKIVVAGDFAKYERELSPRIEREIRRNWLYATQKLCSIEYSPDAAQAVPIGAAGLFIEKLFSVPEMTDHTDEDVGFILLERIAPTRK